MFLTLFHITFTVDFPFYCLSSLIFPLLNTHSAFLYEFFLASSLFPLSTNLTFIHRFHLLQLAAVFPPLLLCAPHTVSIASISYFYCHITFLIPTLLPHFLKAYPRVPINLYTNLNSNLGSAESLHRNH